MTLHHHLQWGILDSFKRVQLAPSGGANTKDYEMPDGVEDVTSMGSAPRFTQRSKGGTRRIVEEDE